MLFRSCKKIRHIDLLTIVRRYWREDLRKRLAGYGRKRYSQCSTRNRGSSRSSRARIVPCSFWSGNAECSRGIAYHNQIPQPERATMLLNELTDKLGHDRMERFPSLNNKIADHWRRYRADPSTQLPFAASGILILQRKSAAARSAGGE